MIEDGAKVTVFQNGNLNFFQRCCHQSGKEHSCNSNTTKKTRFLAHFEDNFGRNDGKEATGGDNLCKYNLTPPFYPAKNTSQELRMLS